MNGLPKKPKLLVILVISLSFLMPIVSAYDITAGNTKNNFVLSSSSYDNDYAVRATSDNNIVFFDNVKGTVPWTYNPGREIGAVAISSDGNYVAVGCEGGMVFFFNKNGDILWKKAIGNSFIRSISISKDNKFIDLTTSFNQVFYVTLDGRQIEGSIRWAGVPTPVTTSIPTVAPTGIPTVNNPIQNDYPFTFNNDLFIWIILGAIAIFVFWAITKNRQTTRPPRLPPQPQKGMIDVETVPYGAKIFLNGIYQGISPITIYNLFPGTYPLEAKLVGYYDDKKNVTINAGQTVHYRPNLRRLQPPSPPTPPIKIKRKLSFQDMITQLGAKSQTDRETAQKELIIKVNTEGKTAIQQLIKELETQPSGIKREIISLLYYLCKEGHDGQKVTEELINSSVTFCPSWPSLQR